MFLHEYNCSKVNNVYAIRGENWKVSLIALDQVKKPTYTSVLAVAKSSSRLKVNQSSQALPPNCHNLTYTVYSIKDYEELTLYPDGPCRDTGLAIAVVSVILQPCPDGFHQSGERCACDERLQAYDARCIVSDGAYIEKGNFWINATYYTNNTYQGLIIGNYCPSGYCKEKRINFTLGHPDLQCGVYRSGLLQSHIWQFQM